MALAVELSFGRATSCVHAHLAGWAVVLAAVGGLLRRSSRQPRSPSAQCPSAPGLRLRARVVSASRASRGRRRAGAAARREVQKGSRARAQDVRQGTAGPANAGACEWCFVRRARSQSRRSRSCMPQEAALVHAAVEAIVSVCHATDSGPGAALRRRLRICCPPMCWSGGRVLKRARAPPYTWCRFVIPVLLAFCLVRPPLSLHRRSGRGFSSLSSSASLCPPRPRRPRISSPLHAPPPKALSLAADRRTSCSAAVPPPPRSIPAASTRVGAGFDFQGCVSTTPVPTALRTHRRDALSCETFGLPQGESTASLVACQLTWIVFSTIYVRCADHRLPPVSHCIPNHSLSHLQTSVSLAAD
ncbi:uncharacterized protein BDZ99DRAFT_529430 [Mytilinidion resinicola]|uniref:Uncharacterized protein n=1 Tax=Mytilinidion resinicola TaxID=574789 RepID=A0A6A6Z801_9PEZI|nr:uncharacterized protein BDZ99DRAFT_529430 [Mytilinidion resinicola]KAF2817166.1 hypothetical protein BDZ99DRAFT_529430 [Mytilinidion resinicola]